jgi:5'-nucleotidase
MPQCGTAADWLAVVKADSVPICAVGSDPPIVTIRAFAGNWLNRSLGAGVPGVFSAWTAVNNTGTHRPRRTARARNELTSVEILLTNDDGIYAPGLAALQKELASLGNVTLVAPAVEQSGVGHSITYLTPLIVNEVFDGVKRRGYAVEGSPADCVKLGITEYCPRRPDLVVSGINYGLNAGINVLYSGTVAAAIEGAFFGLTSVAVSLEFRQHPEFDRAAALARKVIERLLAQKSPAPQLYNVNIPTAALWEKAQVKVVPMDVRQYAEHYEKRVDPRGRNYFWAAGRLANHRDNTETDLTALADGYITVTPLDYDLTKRAAVTAMQDWTFDNLDRETKAKG